jgi:hypothetical protein
MVKPFEDIKPKDFSRIDIYQIDEFNYWINQLKVPGDALVEAVFTVGNARADVEHFLQKLNPVKRDIVG